MLPALFRGVNWQDLSDDVLEELLHVIEAERMRRWKLRRPRSFVEDVRDSMDVGNPTEERGDASP